MRSSTSWNGGSPRSSRRSGRRPASTATRARSRPRCGNGPSACSRDSSGPSARRRRRLATRPVTGEAATPETDRTPADERPAPDADRKTRSAEAVGMRQPGTVRLDRATLLAWLALSRTGALAPGADVGATSLAWYDDLRLAAGPRRRAPWDRLRRRRGVGHRRPGARPARTPASVDDRPPGALSRCAGCSTPGSRTTSSGSPSASTAGKASTTSIRIGLRRRSAGPSASTPSTPAEAGPTRADERDRQPPDGRGRRGRLSSGPASARSTCRFRRRARPGRAAQTADGRSDAAYPSRIRRRSDVGGVPCASTDSRCVR